VKPLTTKTIAAVLATLLLGCAGPAPAATSNKPIKRVRANAATKASGPLYATRPEILQEAQGMAERLGLDAQWVRQAIGQAHYMPGIARAILPPPVGVPKNWTLYRSRFIDAVRIKAGLRFWLANQEALQRAEQQTGVPAHIIVGIIGVETIYGQNTGNFRVIDALCTLAFDFPAAHPKAEARAAFFKSELEEFLALTARTHTDPLALRGSYAGAMGWPQFMPSSWTRYAIDFDGDGRVDLFNSQADVIGSVANYFQAFHWQRGLPTHYPVQFDATTLDLPVLLASDIKPSFRVAELAALGALVDAGGTVAAEPLALIELQNGDAPAQYVAGTENFYVITRYNWSSYYAMAVIELGQAVADAVVASSLPLTPAQAQASVPK
jgi:membrane-bound lytic murein transglycosylase B